MRAVPSVDDMMAAVIPSLQERTGLALDEWVALPLRQAYEQNG